jgi:hypothetical protein
VPTLRVEHDLDEGVLALPRVPLQGRLLRLRHRGLAAWPDRPYI